MTDADLADVLIVRLNGLLQSGHDVAFDIARLIDNRIEVSAKTAEHPTIQVQGWEEEPPAPQLGVLGLLNGLVGVKPGTSTGYIAAEYSDYGQLTQFIRS